MARLLESGKEALRQVADAHIKAAGSSPVLLSYSSDGTPVQISQHVSLTKISEAAPGRKTGKATKEFLVEQAYIRYLDSFGNHHTCCLARDPLALVHGKGGEPVFYCGLQMLPNARVLGHHGISIVHVCFDGALHSVLSRRFHELVLFRALDRRAGDREAGRDANTLWLTEWFIDTRCTCHHVHNGLKWGGP